MTNVAAGPRINAKDNDCGDERRPLGSPDRLPREQVTGMWYRLKVQLTFADVGKRVIIRWRPGPADSKQATDMLGILEQADAAHRRATHQDHQRPRARAPADPVHASAMHRRATL